MRPSTSIQVRGRPTSIPAELEDASALDGCSRIGFFWRILIPLSGPVLVTVGVLSFVMSWNAYLLPLLVLSDPASFTLPLGVQAFSTQYTTDTAAILAFTSLAMLPAIAFFTLAERRIVGGLPAAGRPGTTGSSTSTTSRHARRTSRTCGAPRAPTCATT